MGILLYVKSCYFLPDRITLLLLQEMRKIFAESLEDNLHLKLIKAVFNLVKDFSDETIKNELSRNK